MRKYLLIILLFKINLSVAQDSTENYVKHSYAIPTNNQKKITVAGLSAAGYIGSLYLLNDAWYKNYPKSSFHVFNDNREWLQVDKVGHVWTAYNSSQALYTLWKWTGIGDKQAIWIGTLSGFSYMTVIELLDAHSAGWGWSWGDITANFSGASLFALQQSFFKEQKVRIKFSSHRKKYDSELIDRANSIYGRSLPERMLKDYNAQTYWMSINIKSFAQQSKLPGWLNIAIGYGADGMFGASENIAYDKMGTVIFNRTGIKRYRQWYLSPDIDLTKIKTKNRTLKTVFSLFNSVKLPAPSVEFSNGKFKGHWLHF